MLASVHTEEARGTPVAQELRAERAVAQSALAMVLGILLSGPIALLVVGLVHPQPPWESAARFAAELHPVQLLPYVGGFLLIGGCVALVASLHVLAPRERRARANVALVLTAAFAALIFFNYIVQTTFVPALASPYAPEHDALIGGLTMSNPRSLAWALEMWGYGVFGVATWAIAIVFRGGGLERWTARAFVLNAVLSVAGGIATAVWPSWALTVPGVVSFAVWNLLMVVMGVLVIVVMRRRARA